MNPMEQQKTAQQGRQPQQAPKPYETTDMQEAAFLKSLDFKQVGKRYQGSNRDYMVFLFDIAPDKAKELWQGFQNLGSDTRVHPRRLLIEYEGLRTQRFKG